MNQLKIFHILFSIGAPFPVEHPIINKMLRERTTLKCKYYDQFTLTDGTEKLKCHLRKQIIYVNNIRQITPMYG